MAESQAEKTAEKPFKRLPVDVLPRNYRLELKPDLTAFTFQGTLEITTEVEGMRRERGSPKKTDRKRGVAGIDCAIGFSYNLSQN